MRYTPGLRGQVTPMAGWSERFEDRATRGAMQLRAQRLVVWFALASGGIIAAAPLLALRLPDVSGAVALGCGLALATHAAWLLRQLSRVQGAPWRVELSATGVAVTDAAGRRRAFVWPDVVRVDVSKAGVTVVGAGRLGRLHVPADFAGYTGLAHRLVRYAEATRRPVCVDGVPWEALPLTDVSTVLREAEGQG